VPAEAVSPLPIRLADQSHFIMNGHLFAPTGRAATPPPDAGLTTPLPQWPAGPVYEGALEALLATIAQCRRDLLEPQLSIARQRQRVAATMFLKQFSIGRAFPCQPADQRALADPDVSGSGTDLGLLAFIEHQI